MLHHTSDHFAKAAPAYGDCHSPEELIARHGQPVRRLAWHVHSRMTQSAELEDLIQIGLIALVEAGQGYQDQGHAFTTYASMRVRGAMIDHLRREALVSRSAMSARRRIEDAKARLEQRHLRSVGSAEVAAELGLDFDGYHALVASAAPLEKANIDEAYSDHDVLFADTSDAADVLLEKDEMRELLAEAISGLPPREAQILQLYFIEELNLQEIGQILGTGAARVCQIKKAALARLKIALSEHA